MIARAHHPRRTTFRVIDASGASASTTRMVDSRALQEALDADGARWRFRQLVALARTAARIGEPPLSTGVACILCVGITAALMAAAFFGSHPA